MTAKPLRLLCAVAVAALSLKCGGSGGGMTGTPQDLLQKAPSANGDGQTAQVGATLPNPLRVLVTRNGTAQQGTTVTWAAPGGGSVNPTTSATDATGIATTTWTLGSTAGTQSVTASVSGATGSPVTFTATASAVPVPVIQKTATASGDAQTATVGTAEANPLRVLVTLSGAPQQGTTVTWAAAGTGASVSPTTSMTDASGIATTTWTLGQTAGAQSATATLAGATGSPVTFAATATAGAASQLALASGDNQGGSPNSTLANPLKVKASDQFGNAVSSVTVGWQVTSGTASVSPTSSSTDATGIAQTAVTLGATLGAVTITGSHTGLTGSPVTFHATIAQFATTASVTIGDDFFKSVHNLTQNPAVDTVGAGGTVTWTWTGVNSHSVQSTGTTTFTSSSIKTTGTYSFTFADPGTYTYDCAVHGTIMTGVIVVR